MNAGMEVMRNAFIMIGSFLLAVVVIVLLTAGLFWLLKSQFTPEKITNFFIG